MRSGRGALVLALLGACAPAARTAPGSVEPASHTPQVALPPPQDSAGPTPNLPPITRAPIVPAAVAQSRGWLAREAMGVPEFLAEHPTWDGRGVLIGILDSGVDTGVPGLDSTSTGLPKTLDLRDFSGEGRIALVPLRPSGDTVLVEGHRLTGFGRVRGLSMTDAWYGGVLRERLLGDPPASDVNDNGIPSDTLAMVVARARDGWILLADTDGDGSLADERPVHDYLVGRETFGWYRSGEPPPVSIAVNFSEQAGVPSLDLVFDTEAHGTHVAGIAAGRSIGGAPGFDGVAPGAQLLALKISRNDFGAITTTGSVVRAMGYALRFAEERRLPLVLNMSFGVGNEWEGAARLDALLDSILAAHPEVVFVTSAGNDGPGLSTMGFPGSARRAVTVGATGPPLFFGRLAPASAADPLLFFSSRGGELAKPEVSAPGAVYSTVPRWDMGDEIKTGTSMAAPQIAGVAALLLSGALAEHRAVTASDVRRALVAGARPVQPVTQVDAGAGVPDARRAWRALRGPSPPAEFDVLVEGRRGQSAAFGNGIDSVVSFKVVRLSGTTPVEAQLSSDATWLRAPATVRLDGPATVIALHQAPPREPGLHVGTVRATLPGVAGSLFSLVSAVLVPVASKPVPVRWDAHLVPRGEGRIAFMADSGRPFRLRMAARPPSAQALGWLFQPGGHPTPGDEGSAVGADTAAAVYDVDGSQARGGLYEAVLLAPPNAGADVQVSIDPAPFVLSPPAAQGDVISARVGSVVDTTVTGTIRVGLTGGERRFILSGAGGGDVSEAVQLPAWARRVEITLDLDPDQWPRFTDFGFTLIDSAGRILKKEPANYAHTVLTLERAPTAVAEVATLVLSPAFAEPGAMERWTGKIAVRLYAEQPSIVPVLAGEEFRLAPRQSIDTRVRYGVLPWSLPGGFVPLSLTVVESAGIPWTWESVLPPSGGWKSP